MFQEALAPLVDDATFYIVTGYRDLDDVAAVPMEERFANDALLSYAGIAQIGGDVNLLSGLIAQAVDLPDADYLRPLRERFEAAADSLQRSLSSLDGTEALSSIATELIGFGTGEDGAFNVRARLFSERRHELSLLEESRLTAAELVSQVGELVRIHEAQTMEAAATSELIVTTGSWLLLALNIVSVSGALLIAWLYVGRGLLRRLTGLAGTMRQMAGGDLTVPVNRSGSDEVTDMADSLEVFRRHALEVQRLNLVEKLAQEVNEKNAALETTLAELERAKDRIVVQEKMASLGELTAGIAHEIKNPLNFVNNFSMLSGELLEDLQRELEPLADTMAKATREEIETIIADLRLSMEKISAHGKRADGIVRSMLQHSRGDVGEPQPVRVNDLVDEFMNLAYHGMRAQGTDFNATLERDYDQAAGVIQAVPQDLGRVLLNVITNAFQAMREKVLKGADGSYEPTLLATTRNHGDRVEIRIRDNGPGIPDKIAAKVFEPFFTTKPTGEGTGLGLSISYDVVVKQHGGTLDVTSELGKFTEFIIALPRGTPAPELP
jgi:signal transduction histidine kinase